MAIPDESATPPGVKSMLVVVSKKSTVPVGVPDPGALAVTVAVKMTVCPTSAEAGEAADGGRCAVLGDRLVQHARGAGMKWSRRRRLR